MARKNDLSRFLQRHSSLFLANVLPLSLYRQYLSLLGLYYYAVNRDDRKNVSRSLAYVLGARLGWLAFQTTLWKTYLGIFEHYQEKVVNAYTDLSDMIAFLHTRISFPGRSTLDRLIGLDRGAILVTGHFGAVEYIPLYLASKRYRPSMILRFKTNRLRRTLIGKSTSVDLELIDADSPNVIFRALTAIKEKRVLITLCDEVHSWRPCCQSNAQLFGYRVPKDRTLDVLYKRSKAPVCFGMLRREHAGYEFCMHPVADGGGGGSICDASWKLLERYVYSHPEQWYQWPNFYPEFTRYISAADCYDH